jgi:uncharacterized protein YbjT (DUF2867 family)
MSILVIGGTGMVGNHVVRGLLTKGAAVHVLARSADHAHVLPLTALRFTRSFQMLDPS